MPVIVTVLATIFFYLMAAHALLDFPLQGEQVAVNKNPNSNTELQKAVPWYYWMGSHAMLHGAAVMMITNSLVCGLAETVAHFIIDLNKCNGRYSIHIDQLLHMLCKVLWIFYLMN
jgi:hypothetical protein